MKMRVIWEPHDLLKVIKSSTLPSTSKRLRRKTGWKTRLVERLLKELVKSGEILKEQYRDGYRDWWWLYGDGDQHMELIQILASKQVYSLEQLREEVLE